MSRFSHRVGGKRAYNVAFRIHIGKLAIVDRSIVHLEALDYDPVNVSSLQSDLSNCLKSMLIFLLV